MFLSVRKIVIALSVLLFAASCTSTKDLTYFQDLPDKNVIDLQPIQMEERTIENGDDLYINFSAKDNDAAQYFNKNTIPVSAAAVPGAAPVTTTSPGSSYIVGNDGYLEFTRLGLIKVTGLTAGQLRAKLVSSVSPFLKEPVVEVRFNTFKITVLGEVRSPGRYILDMQRTTIFEALAAAGDLPLSAERYDVELYRDYNGQRKIYKIDLTKSAVLNNTDIFQMRHNDVLYVKPLKNTIVRENFNQLTSVVSISLSIITLLIAITRL